MAAKDEIMQFLTTWKKDGCNVKPALDTYLQLLENNPDIELDFKSRPGISYSVRAKNIHQKKRDLFVLLDVVDDDPENRWLSICFYADLVSDPEEKGDVVPDGLFGENAICFNLDENDGAMQTYIAERLREAAQRAQN